VLTFHVADSLTGRIIGRLYPTEWTWTDPLTGSAEGSFTIPIPVDTDRVPNLINLTRPHIRQICARDELERWWFGGPVLGDPERNGHTVVVPVGDWRTWFYAAPIRPNTNGTRRDYIRVTGGPGGQVEQNQAIADLAAIGLATVGAPRLIVDTPISSGIMRDVTARMFKMTGEAMDNVARRHDAPDWWTYIATDPADTRNVIAHVTVAYPERSLLSTPMVLRHEVVLRSQLGKGGNILTYTWPRGTPPPSRVIGVGSDPPPDEKWAIAEDPDLVAGTRLAWDEVWQLPEGIASPANAFEHAQSRLEAHGNDLGVIEVGIKPDATDLGSWGPGDRTRMIVADGWRDVELPEAHILSRTLTGRGPDVTGVTVSVNLSAIEADIEEPEEISEE
jgi:hypothetical protein